MSRGNDMNTITIILVVFFVLVGIGFFYGLLIAPEIEFQQFKKCKAKENPELEDFDWDQCL